MEKCSMKTTKLRVPKIVTPFSVFEEHLGPNWVIILTDDGKCEVKLLELLCLTLRRYKAKVERELKIQKDDSETTTV